MTPILDSVRSAFQAGLCLLPARDDGSKAPDCAWKAFQAARPTVDNMRAWDFSRRSGFGLIAGPVSGHRECWDFDCSEIFDAFVAGADACGLGDVVARIRAGYEDRTPGGGVRWIVEYPASVTFTDCTLARRPGRDGEPAVKTLIELPTFAILAPSNGTTHPSGKAYVRVSGDFATIARYTITERDALLALARSFDRMPRREYAPPAAKARHATADDLKPGDDFNQRAAWPDILPDWTLVFERGGVQYLRRPGKAHGISATINALGTDRLHIFSSSTSFDPDTSYSKFGAFALLHHGGDFSAAGKALARDGYGTRPIVEVTDRREPDRAIVPIPAAGATWRYLRDVEREYVDWLWRGRLARGTLALWIGDGGLGKSRASNDVAARVSTGNVWPDGGQAPLGSVVILSAEDSASYTIRPAIEAAGGDLSRVAVLDAVRTDDGTERTFQLATDLPVLEPVLDATGATLLIVDPLSAYFGTRLDSYRDTDVRAVLEPLVRLAERRRLVVLGIMHVGKGTDKQARHRALGSVAFVNAARLVFAVGQDPDDATRRLLVPVKANLCREAPALAFRLEDADGVARVAWESAPVPDVSAELVLNGHRPATADDEERTDAEAVLRELLETETWPLAARDAEAAARAHGLHVRSLRRAAQKLGVRIEKATFRGGWQWFAPKGTDTTTIDPPAKGTDALSVSPSASVAQADQEDTKRSVCDSVSPSEIVSPSHVSKGTVSPCAPSSKQQQNTHVYEGDSRHTPRAREAEGVPGWVTADEVSPEPGSSDAAFADRDEEAC